MTDIHARLAELGITLPEAAAPVAAYVPTVEANGLLHISGQVSFSEGQLMTGRLGEDRDLDYGVRAARAAVGVPSLPLGAAVEIDAVVALRAG
jgi:enamine deaminase RidA (YjgF/YER057c/UK114 family)